MPFIWYTISFNNYPIGLCFKGSPLSGDQDNYIRKMAKVWNYAYEKWIWDNLGEDIWKSEKWPNMLFRESCDQFHPDGRNQTLIYFWHEHLSRAEAKIDGKFNSWFSKQFHWIITFNTDILKEHFNPTYFKNVTLHELGHAKGLTHDIFSAVMWGDPGFSCPGVCVPGWIDIYRFLSQYKALKGYNLPQPGGS